MAAMQPTTIGKGMPGTNSQRSEPTNIYYVEPVYRELLRRVMPACSQATSMMGACQREREREREKERERERRRERRREKGKGGRERERARECERVRERMGGGTGVERERGK